MELLEHQKNSLVSFINSNKRGLCLYHDTGTGKTYTTLSILDKLEIKEAPGRNAIAIRQDDKESAFYIIQIKDGKIVKGDLMAFL